MSTRVPTPLSGVEAIDDWEDTGVTHLPDSQRPPGSAYTGGEKMTPPTPPQSGKPPDDGRATARKALAKIDELGRRFEEHTSSFEKHTSSMTKRFDEHAAEDREQFRKIDEKLDDQNKVLATLRENSASNTATLAGLSSELRHKRELEVVETKTTTALQVVEKTAMIEDSQDQKAHKRKLVLEWSKVVGGIMLALGSALAGYLVSQL